MGDERRARTANGSDGACPSPRRAFDNERFACTAFNAVAGVTTNGISITTCVSGEGSKVYIPSSYREERPAQLLQFIREQRFGILVSHGSPGLHATHLPFLVGEDLGRDGMLITHLARANPHWQSLAADAEVLIIFPGPWAYISPNWYQSHPSVPTWDYAAVHVHGRASVVTEPEQLKRLLATTVETFDRAVAGSWRYAEVPDELKERLYPGVIGVDIRIDEMFGTFKLSQDKSPADRASVRAGLQQRGAQGDNEIAAMIDGLERGGPGSNRLPQKGT